MMQITDVIKVLGNTPLKEFPWGCTVRDTVNLFVDKTNTLTLESTGIDVQAAIDSLPEDVRELVLKAKLDPSRRCVTSPVGGGMVVEHAETGEPAEDPEEDLKRAMLTPTFIVTTVVVVTVLMSSLFMVSNLSANKDFDWKGLFQAFFKVFGLPFE